MKKRISGIITAAVFLFSMTGFSNTATISGKVSKNKSRNKVSATATIKRTGPKVVKKNQNYIGLERARAIALSRVKGANNSHVRKLKFDYEDGRPVYEGEIRYNGWEYEFDIDAVTGKVLKWERERD